MMTNPTLATRKAYARTLVQKLGGNTQLAAEFKDFTPARVDAWKRIGLPSAVYCAISDLCADRELPQPPPSMFGQIPLRRRKITKHARRRKVK